MFRWCFRCTGNPPIEALEEEPQQQPQAHAQQPHEQQQQSPVMMQQQRGQHPAIYYEFTDDQRPIIVQQQQQQHQAIDDEIFEAESDESSSSYAEPISCRYWGSDDLLHLDMQAMLLTVKALTQQQLLELAGRYQTLSKASRKMKVVCTVQKTLVKWVEAVFARARLFALGPAIAAPLPTYSVILFREQILLQARRQVEHKRCDVLNSFEYARDYILGNVVDESARLLSQEVLDGRVIPHLLYQWLPPDENEQFYVVS